MNLTARKATGSETFTASDTTLLAMYITQAAFDRSGDWIVRDSNGAHVATIRNSAIITDPARM